MENSTKILGLNKKVVTVFHKILLIAMLHNTFVAPSQNMLNAYFNYKDQALHYKGSSMPKLEPENIINQIPNFSNSTLNNSVGIIKNRQNSTLITNKFETELSYPSDVKEGIIGVTKEMPIDNPSDNLFKFNVGDLPNSYDKVVLKYDLFGLQDDNGVSRSINNHSAIGGHIIKTQMGWTTQTEEIDANWLEQGENKILFTTPRGATYSYRIKNLSVSVQKGNPDVVTPRLVINKKQIIFKKNETIYVKGFIRTNSDDAIKITIDDIPVTINQGEFEGLISLSKINPIKNFVVVKANDKNGLIGQEIISFDNLIEADAIYKFENNNITATTNFKKFKQGNLSIDGASIKIGDSCLTTDKEISLSQLRYIDIAPMSSGIVNVTKGGKAYRFLPDGTKFDKPVKISIEYDSILLPKGTNPKEIKTYFFDTKSKNWVAVQTDSVNSKTRMVSSLTNHFTDYINGIIQVPESPQTAGFTATMMNDIKAADPSAEMTLISPPEASQKGDANVSYPIKIPAGRKGMQPQLAVQYSNEGGNGWLGQGWSVSVPSVSIDTRWGVPAFHPTEESEIYSLGGEQLMYPKVPKIGSNPVEMTDWMPNRHHDVAVTSGTGYDTTPMTRNYELNNNVKIFTPRKQGSFAKIERLGGNPAEYYWKVTNTDGSINWFGGNKEGIVENAIIRQAAGITANIVHWGLFMTEDVFGNCVKYTYTNEYLNNLSGQNANLNGGKIFNIESIYYTGFNDADYKYAVQFSTTGTIRNDVSINARLGLKQVEPYRLDNINVRLLESAEYIRNYKFDYGSGVFNKGLLLSVAELDVGGKEFYKHKFDYYNDISQNGVTSFFGTEVVTTICNTCPNPIDTDGDGIQDCHDQCPTQFGLVSNNGCPVTNTCYQVNVSVPKKTATVYTYFTDQYREGHYYRADWNLSEIWDEECLMRSSRLINIVKDGATINFPTGSFNNFDCHVMGNTIVNLCPNQPYLSYPIYTTSTQSIINGDKRIQNINFVPTITQWIANSVFLNPISVDVVNLGWLIRWTNGQPRVRLTKNAGFNITIKSEENVNASITAQLWGDGYIVDNVPYAMINEQTKPFYKTSATETFAAPTNISVTAAGVVSAFGPYNLYEPAGFTAFQTAFQAAYPGVTVVQTITGGNLQINITNSSAIVFNSITFSGVNIPTTTAAFAPCPSSKLAHNEKTLFSKINPTPVTNTGDYIDYFGNLLNNFTIGYTSTVTGNPNCPTFTNSSFPISTPSFNSAGAMLGSTASEGFNIAGQLGFGIDFKWNGADKNITLGGQYGHNWDRSESLTASIDINGDGLEDEVFKQSASIFWRKHIVNRTYNSAGTPIVTHSFAPAQRINSKDDEIGDFFRSNGESSNWNFQVNFEGFAGYNRSNNWSRNNVYFTDANSDGLMDIVNYGTVYFNHLDSNNNPRFEPESINTENMLIKGEAVTVTKPVITNTAEVNTPNFDVVKVWEAPADGNIQIENTITNTEPAKEVVATVEMGKVPPVPVKCYTVSFPVPPNLNQTIYKYYQFNNSGTTYQYDGNCSTGVPLNKCIPSYWSKFISIGINGQIFNAPTNLYYAHGDINGVLNLCPSTPDVYSNTYIPSGQFSCGSMNQCEVIQSPDYYLRMTNFLNSVKSNFPEILNFSHVNNSRMNISTCSPATIYQGMPNGKGIRVEFDSTSPSMSLILNSSHMNGYFANQFIFNQSRTQSTPNSSYIATVPIQTNISINSTPVINNPYTLSNSTSFNQFKNQVQSQFSGSTVTLNTATNMITVVINNSPTVYSTITLAATNGTATNTYNFTEINCSSLIEPPVITVTPATLNNMTYDHGMGPSTTKTFVVTGSFLTDNITLVAPSHYEISKLPNSGFTSLLTLIRTANTVPATTIYVRLKAGLPVSIYNDETIIASSTSAVNKIVTCFGSVNECGRQGFDNYHINQTSPPFWTVNLTSPAPYNTTVGNYGVSAPSLRFSNTGDKIFNSNFYYNGGTNLLDLSFWIKGVNSTGSSLLVEGLYNSTWQTIENITNLPTTGTVKSYNFTSSYYSKFRLTYTKVSGDLLFDDIKISCNCDVCRLQGITDSSEIKPNETITILTNNDWKDYKPSKEEIELARNQFIAKGGEINSEFGNIAYDFGFDATNNQIDKSITGQFVYYRFGKEFKWLDNKGIELIDNNIIKVLQQEFQSQFDSQYETVQIYHKKMETERRLQSQKDAQTWLDDYYKKQEQETAKTTLETQLVNPTTCTFTPTDMCLLDSFKLNATTPTITRTITTTNTNCNPAGGVLKVKKGDRIYFRVHAKPASAGADSNPKVNWNPKVSYTDATMLATLDQNGLKPFQSNYSDGFILSQEQPIAFSGSGEALISWDPITVANPTDTVTYEIVQRTITGGSSPTTTDAVLYSKTCVANSASTLVKPSTGTFTAGATVVAATTGANPTPEAVKITVTQPPATSTGQSLGICQFIFRVRSTSNLNWKAIEWKPKMVSKTTQNVIGNNNANEGPVNTAQTKYPIVDYSIYKSYLCGTPYNTVNIGQYNGGNNLSIVPVLPTFAPFVSTSNPGDQGVLNFVVKRDNKLIGKRVITVVNGSVTTITDGAVTVSSTTPIVIGTGISNNIEIGYYTDDSKRVVKSPTDISLLQRVMNMTTVATITNGSTNYALDKTKVNLFQKPLSLYGPMYRQWGQFLYNPVKATGAQTPAGNLSVNLLKEDQLTLTDAQATTLYDNLYQGGGSTATNSTISNLQNILTSNNNSDATAAALQNQITAIQNSTNSATNFPFMTANPNRDTNNGTIYERWIGLHNENYSSELGFRGARLSQLYSNFSQAPATVTAPFNTGAVGIDKESEGSGHSVSGGWGPMSFSRAWGGISNTLTDYIDLNGDRYPDIVTQNQVQFTRKTGGLNSPTNRGIGGPMSIDANSSWGTTASGNFNVSGKPNAGAAGASIPKKATLSVGKPAVSSLSGGAASIGLSGNLSAGANNTQLIWADINGDGLSDKISDDGVVNLNLGNNTFDSSNWGTFDLGKGISRSFGGGLGFGWANGSIEAGVSLGRTDSDTERNLVDLNGDGLLDRLEHQNGGFTAFFNEGNKMSGNGHNFNIFTLNENASTTNMGLNATGTFSIIWPLYLFVITIPLKIPDVSITASGSQSTNRTKKSISDYDGDGFPDLIEEIDNNSVKVYHSNIRRTNLLKTVHNPLGGSFTLDYKVQKVDYNNPHAKWALSSVVINDNYNLQNDGVDTYNKEFVYENAKYDRRERDFYGYETVKNIDRNTDGTIYRTSVSKYHNQSYFLNGMMKESYVVQGEDVAGAPKYSRTENTYQIKKLDSTNNAFASPQVNLPLTFDVGGTEGRRSAAVVLESTINELYELNSSPLITTKVEMVYDQKGRVSSYINHGNLATTNDNYSAIISYHSTPALISKNIISVPYNINVIANGTVVRNRSTAINTNGSITKVITHFNGTTATTRMKYDPYGNMTHIEFPENHNLQRMYYNYKFDSIYHKYIVGISDAFNYGSTAEYDPRFDKVLKTIDLTGNKMIYRYDSFGRNTIILAPKEIAAGRKYTIKFEYFPKFSDLAGSPYDGCVDEKHFMPVAVTNHFDQQHPDNDIQTITFIDGLARPVQVKKDIELNNGSPAEPSLQEAMSVSGKAEIDVFGRAVKQFHPFFEKKNCSENMRINEFDSSTISPPSETVLDELDRPTQSIDPEGHISYMEYGIDTDNQGNLAIKTKSIVDQNGSNNVVSETFKNVNGKVIATKNEGTNGDIWTNFNYNNISELMEYTDTEGHTTKYQYDMLGRKTSINHPDNGLTTFKYDNASNLRYLQTANLASIGHVEYQYNFNRLNSVIYPQNPDGSSNISNVVYKYGDTGNQTGRLVYQADATGTQTFQYGNMGEMTTNTRIVVAPNIPTRIFNTNFEYDSWNRLQQMIYPDGEKVRYKYNLGGSLVNMINSDEYEYIKRIDYDHYEQRNYLLYGNNTESFYSYSPTLRRMTGLNVKTHDQQDLFNNDYQFDFVGNVTQIKNNASPNTTNQMGGEYIHDFKYDNLNRLAHAKGYFNGDGNQLANGNDATSHYTLNMKYNNMHSIENKEQYHDKNGVQFDANTYSNNYKYNSNNHQLILIEDQNTGNTEEFKYDNNGNITYKNQYTASTGTNDEKNYLWDESNRLRVIVQEHGHNMQNYFYDASGERVLKASSDYTAVFENGQLQVPSSLTINAYTQYPSAYLVISPSGEYSKHYYAGTQRIVSRVADQPAEIFNLEGTVISSDPETSGEKPQPFDDKVLQTSQKQDLQTYLDKAKIKASFKENEKPIDPCRGLSYEECCKLYPERCKGGRIYYFHPDHLGTTTFLTDANGDAYQFFLNLPFGETMAEQKSIFSNFATPYKFTGKELDDETGMYYFGARYYSARESIWWSVDPLAERGPEYSPYCFTMNNPMNMVDPDGRWPFPSWATIKSTYNETKKYVSSQATKAVNYIKNHAVVQIEAKATIGVQVGVKTPFGSAGAGIITADIGKVGASNTKGVYAKEGDGKGHNFAEVNVKLLDKKLGVGAKVDWVNDTVLPNGNGNGSNGNTDLLKASSYQGKLEWEANAGPGKSGPGFTDGVSGDISVPAVKYKATTGNKEDCTSCLETSFGAKAILGVEIKVKIGVKD